MASPEQNLNFADLSHGAVEKETPKPRYEEAEKPENFSMSPIVETKDSVSFLGVKLEKGNGGSEVPGRERFSNIERTLTNEDLRQMQKIATALKLKQPILLEEYSGSGKTTKVEHMCSLLNTEVHYANCHDFDADVLIGKMSTDETTKSGFGWQDGLVMHAIRNGGILFLDEYNFMRGDVRARMHEILDALLRGKENISLIENNHEIVPVNPNLRIVAAQNPPGGEFGDREVLDPAQYTRYVQIKGPSEMPKETKLARALGFVNRDNVITIAPEEYLTTEARLAPEQLAEIPGVEEILRKYIEFEEGFEQMVKNRQIGADQPQPIYTAFQRDLDRVWQFVQVFYNGDINETFQKALRYYYSNRLELGLDRQKIEELINHVAYVHTTETKRKGLEKEIAQNALKDKTEKELAEIMASGEIPDSVKDALSVKETMLSPDILEQIKEAKEIFGKDFIGPEEVKTVFGIETGTIPAIPFSKSELEKAHELNQVLILRLPMTMAQINESLKGKVKDDKKLLYSFDEATGKLEDGCWYKDEAFYNEEMSKAGWALVSKEVVPDSISSDGKDYWQQTKALVQYTKDEVFSGSSMPAEYQEAIDEFNKYADKFAGKDDDEINTLLGGSDWQKYAEELSSLKINQLTRQSPTEVLYDIATYYQINGKRLLENTYTWTSRRDSVGSLVNVGDFDAGGATVCGSRPGGRYGTRGASFSRSR